MKRNIILVLISICFIAIFWYVIFNKNENETGKKETFDPSIYFEGDPVSPEEMEGVLTEGELEELNRMFGE